MTADKKYLQKSPLVDEGHAFNASELPACGGSREADLR